MSFERCFLDKTEESTSKLADEALRFLFSGEEGVEDRSSSVFPVGDDTSISECSGDSGTSTAAGSEIETFMGDPTSVGVSEAISDTEDTSIADENTSCSVDISKNDPSCPPVDVDCVDAFGEDGTRSVLVNGEDMSPIGVSEDNRSIADRGRVCSAQDSPRGVFASNGTASIESSDGDDTSVGTEFSAASGTNVFLPIGDNFDAEASWSLEDTSTSSSVNVFGSDDISTEGSGG